MKRSLKLASVGAVLTALVSLAMGQESRVYREGGNWVQEVSGNLAAAKNLRVKVESGSVRVVGGSQSGITYVIHRLAYTSSEEQARRELESYKLSTSVRGDTAWIVADWVGSRNRKCGGDFTIKVPRNLELVKVETEGGNIVTTGVAGRAEVQSGGGTIRMDDIGGSITAETGGGTIDVGNAGGDVSLRTGGGTIRVGSAKGKIVAESGGGSVSVASGLQGAVLQTGAGNIHIDKCVGNVRAITAGGSIDLGDIAGPVDIQTGGGSIRLASAKGYVKADTGGGMIELNGVPSAHAETGGGGIVAKFLSSGERADSFLETGAGDITVYLASDVAVSIRAAIEMANGHSIRANDFPAIHVNTEGGDWGPRTVTAEGNLNGGGPVLKVRTSTGNIVFRRAN